MFLFVTRGGFVFFWHFDTYRMDHRVWWWFLLISFDAIHPFFKVAGSLCIECVWSNITRSLRQNHFWSPKKNRHKVEAWVFTKNHAVNCSTIPNCSSEILASVFYFSVHFPPWRSIWRCTWLWFHGFVYVMLFCSIRIESSIFFVDTSKL